MPSPKLALSCRSATQMKLPKLAPSVSLGQRKNGRIVAGGNAPPRKVSLDGVVEPMSVDPTLVAIELADDKPRPFVSNMVKMLARLSEDVKELRQDIEERDIEIEEMKVVIRELVLYCPSAIFINNKQVKGKELWKD